MNEVDELDELEPASGFLHNATSFGIDGTVLLAECEGAHG